MRYIVNVFINCLIKQSPKNTSNKSRNPIFTSKIFFLLNVRGVSYKPTVRFIRINRMFFANNTVIYMQMTVLLFVIMHINTVFYLFISLLLFIYKG